MRKAWLRKGSSTSAASISGSRSEEKTRNNPVLFVIHGGPGSCYSIFTPHLRAWEKHFTIVQWDQRGAGKTFARPASRNSVAITMKQLTADGIEIAEYLRAHLRKDQIFLLASSMGSTFGMDIVRCRPDMFYAYIGTDQNVGRCARGMRIIASRFGTAPFAWNGQGR